MNFVGVLLNPLHHSHCIVSSSLRGFCERNPHPKYQAYMNKKQPSSNGIRIRSRILISIVFLGFVFTTTHWFQRESTQTETERFLDENLAMAMQTYGVCRITNGFVSILQESTLSVSPFGMGFELGVGQILDPINDAIERLSNLSSLSLSITFAQRVLFSILQTVLRIPFLFSMVVICILFVFIPKSRFYLFTLKLSLALGLLYFSIPIISILGNKINQHFFSPEMAKNQSQLKKMIQLAETQEALTLSSLSPSIPIEENSFLFGMNLLNPIKNWMTHNYMKTKKLFVSANKSLKYIQDNFTEILNAFLNLFKILLAKLLFQVFLIPLSCYFLSKKIYFGIQEFLIPSS